MDEKRTRSIVGVLGRRRVTKGLLYLLLAVVPTLLFVWPVYQTTSEPRQPLVPPDGFLVLTMATEDNEVPKFWVTATMAPPEQMEAASTFTLSAEIAGSVESKDVPFSILAAGSFARSLDSCDDALPVEVRYQDLTDEERAAATYSYGDVLNLSPGRAVSDIEVTREAGANTYKRISGTIPVDPGSRASTSFECILFAGGGWTRTASTNWALGVSRIGLIASSVGSETDEDPYLYQNVQVSTGTNLFFQEAFPAPTTRDGEAIRFSQTDTGFDQTGSLNIMFMEPLSASFTDARAESSQRGAVFLAGIIGGICAALIVGALTLFIDEAIREPQASPPATPQEPQASVTEQPVPHRTLKRRFARLLHNLSTRLDEPTH